MNFTSLFLLHLMWPIKKSKIIFVAPVAFLLDNVVSSWDPGTQINLQSCGRREKGLRWQLAVCPTVVPQHLQNFSSCSEYVDSENN